MAVHQPSFSRLLLYVLLALTLMRGIIYASVAPPWQAPDEPAQFERVRASLSSVEWNSTSQNGPAWYDDLIKSLFTFGFWNFLDDPRRTYAPEVPLSHYITPYQEAYNGLYGNRAAYAFIGWPLFVVSDQDIILQLFLVRLNTVLMNLGVIWLAYLMVKTIFPNEPFLFLGVPLLILFNPQHTHLLSTVNNGNLAELLATAALYWIVKGIIQGFSWPNIVALIAFSVTAMWVKATAYFLPFTIGIIGLFYLWGYRRYWGWLIPAGLALAGLGYFLAPERLWLLMAEAWHSLQTGQIYLDPIVPIDLFRSFWATPGWVILLTPPVLYWLPTMACALAVAGLLVAIISKRRLLVSKGMSPQLQALIVLAVAAVVAIAVLLSWNALTQSIVYRQGRSIFPVVVPLYLFLLLGWRQLIPSTWRGTGLLGVTGLLFLFDSLILFDYIIPIFYSRY